MKKQTNKEKKQKKHTQNLTSVPLPPLIALMYLSTSSAQSWRWFTPDSL